MFEPSSFIFQQDTIKSMAIFYIILYSHFNIDLLTCYQKSYINNNKTIQYILGFFCLFFLVTLFSTTGNMKYIPPLQKLLHTIFYYILFLLSVRLDYRIMTLTIFLIIFVYFLQLNVNYYKINLNSTSQDKPDNLQIDKQYEQYQYWITWDYPIKIRLFPVKKSQLNKITYLNYILYYIIIILLVFGFICYGGEMRHKIKNNKSLTWFTVLFDTSICKMKEPKSLLYYFKMGLGIKI
jgi:uncharacterized membrane protein